MGTPEPHSEHDELLAQLGWMRALAMRLVRDPDVADDVLQRACLLALQQSPGHVRTGDRLRAWLASVTRRMVGHAWRTEDRRSRRERVVAQPEALPATVDLVARREILRRLVQAVTALDEPYFSTLVRRYYEGLSTTEIAVQDGIAPEAVRQRLSRARRELRENLEPTRRAGWLPSLSIASAPSHPFLRGLIMVEHSSRPLILKSVAAAVVATLCVATWLTVRTESGANEGGPGSATSSVVHADREPQTSRRDLPAGIEAPTVSEVAAAPMVPTTGIALLADGSGALVQSARDAFDRLYDAMEASMTGPPSPDQLMVLTQELLARIDPAEPAAPSEDGKSISRTLLDDPDFGRVTLRTRVKPLSATEAGDTGTQDFYSITAELNMAPGHLSGVVEDGARKATMDIGFRFDADGKPTIFTTLTTTDYQLTRDLRSRLDTGITVPAGASVVIGPDGSTWRQIIMKNIEPSDDGQPRVLFTQDEPVEAAGSLAEMRTDTLERQLRATKPAEPR